MKTSAALLLMLGFCVAETQLRGKTVSQDAENEILPPERSSTEAAATSQPSCPPDIHTVLREMSVLIAEQRVELRHLETRLKASEDLVEHLQSNSQAHDVNLSAVDSRLKSSEAALSEQRVSIDEHTQTLHELRNINEGRKIAFAVSLETDTSVYTGPYTNGQTLNYKHIFTNVGNSYDPVTGFFSAPVRGVYEFHFTTYAGGGIDTGLILRKNKQNQAMVWSVQEKDMNNASNGVILLLEAGDKVDIYLPPNHRVLDNGSHHTTFRGHLLFQVEPQI